MKMKKFLAMLLAGVMALSMVACAEDDDDEDENDNSSIVDSSDKDDKDNKDDSSKEDESKDDESKDDESKDDSSKEDESKDDESKDDSSKADDDEDERVDVTISNNSQGELVNGYAVAGNLKLKLEDGWTREGMNGNVYFVPSDYQTTGNNLNIIITAKDESIKLLKKEDFEELYKAIDESFAMKEFKKIKVNGYDGIGMEYSLSGMTLTQLLVCAKEESYAITFTGTTGAIYSIDEIVDALTIK